MPEWCKEWICYKNQILSIKAGDFCTDSIIIPSLWNYSNIMSRKIYYFLFPSIFWCWNCMHIMEIERFFSDWSKFDFLRIRREPNSMNGCPKSWHLRIIFRQFENILDTSTSNNAKNDISTSTPRTVVAQGHQVKMFKPLGKSRLSRQIQWCSLSTLDSSY
jgi:hypothetical protein